MKKYYLIMYLLAGLEITGCYRHAAPNQKILVPTHTRSGIPYSVDSSDLRCVAWWNRLHDSQLNTFIQRALACNNQIHSAQATIIQAQAQIKAAQFAWLPTLDGSANGFSGTTWHTNINPNGPFAQSTLFSNISNLRFHGYYAGFVPSYSINILNTINNVRVAKANLAVECAQAQAVKLAIISQMSGAYFMLLSQRAQWELEHSLVHSLKKLHELDMVRYKAGMTDIEDVTRLEQDIADEETKIPEIEKVIAQTENTIHLLLNENPGSISVHNTLFELNIDHIIPANIPSGVLKNRPDVIVALNNLKSAFAKVGISYSAFFPTISLTGLLGQASLDLTHLLHLSTNLWIGQALASTKLLNPSAYVNIKAAKAGADALYYEYVQTLRSVFADVDNNITNEQKNRIAYAQSYKAYIAAKKAYSIALTQYQAGAKDYRTAITAKINATRYQLRVVQEKAQLLDSVVQVYNALGGGYA